MKNKLYYVLKYNLPKYKYKKKLLVAEDIFWRKLVHKSEVGEMMTWWVGVLKICFYNPHTVVYTVKVLPNVCNN